MMKKKMINSLVQICKAILPCRIDWPHWMLRLGTMRNYKIYHGYSFDLDHPSTFTEKILWYITEYDCTEISKLTDKVLFKSYVSKILGEGKVIEMFGHWDNIKDFERDWEKMPESLVLKSNIQGSGHCIKIIKDKSKVNYEALIDEVSQWLKPRNTLLDNYVCRMYNSKPQILAEKYMEEFGSQLNDYKFFCFNGEPYCMYVASEQFTTEIGDYPIAFYDLDWNQMPVSYGKHPVKEMVKPKHFEQMKEYAKKLSVGYPFVRVDFFDTPEKLYLAEMTFCPGGACTAYNPPSFNQRLGELFIMPSNK